MRRFQVTVVKEVLPPTPLKNLAAQYKLPPSFYNNTTPCPGCAGCDQHEETGPTLIWGWGSYSWERI